MSVNKIEVTYGRTIQPKEYESKRAEATIGVALEEGETNIDLELDEAMSYAMNVVHTTLGIGAAKATKPSSNPETSKGNISDDPEDRKDPEVELTRGQKAARTRAANKAAKEADIDAIAAAAHAADEPLPEDDDDEIALDDLAGERAEEDFDEITDAELGAEINKKVRALKAAGRADAVAVVKKDIASFNAGDTANFTAGMMTQAQRRKFLVKLDARVLEAS